MKSTAKAYYACDLCGVGTTQYNFMQHGSHHLSKEQRAEAEQLSHQEVEKEHVDWDSVGVAEARSMLMAAFRRNIKKIYEAQKAG